MYIGSLAKDILRILVPYLDREEKEKGLPAVERMSAYKAGEVDYACSWYPGSSPLCGSFRPGCLYVLH